MRAFIATAALVGGFLIAPPALAADTTSTVTWGDCPTADLRDGGFDCATLKVPLDRKKPEGSKARLALIRHRSDGSDPIGSLIFNPGGPGGVGSHTIDWAWANLPQEVKDRFDLVTWDPRGLGLSKPVLEDCAGSLPRRPLTGKVSWKKVAQKFVKDIGEQNSDCQDKNAKLVPHISTNENVTDLERIRVAVGDEKLTYWGMSYGTRIGYVYALRHPDRIRTMTLDGSIDPAGSALLLAEGAAGPDQAFGSLTDLYPQARRQYNDVIEKLNRKTVSLPNKQRLDRWVFRDVIFLADAQQSAYPGLATFIDWVHTALFEEGSARDDARSQVSMIVRNFRKVADQHGNAGGVFAVTNCNDYTDRPTVDQAMPLIRQQVQVAPQYGGTLGVEFALGCSGLDLAGDQIPLITGKGSGVPALILGASRDGSTVVQWTARMSRAFPKSRTVTYAGGQHVTWGAARSECVNAVADAYVLTQTLPARDVGCANAAEKLSASLASAEALSDQIGQ